MGGGGHPVPPKITRDPPNHPGCPQIIPSPPKFAPPPPPPLILGRVHKRTMETQEHSPKFTPHPKSDTGGALPGFFEGSPLSCPPTSKTVHPQSPPFKSNMEGTQIFGGSLPNFLEGVLTLISPLSAPPNQSPIPPPSPKSIFPPIPNPRRWLPTTAGGVSQIFGQGVGVSPLSFFPLFQT